MSEELKRANEIIFSKKPTKYKNNFHYDVPVGWMNDPNGPIEYNGEYHVFYQYMLDSYRNGATHWAHVKTKDFLHWETLPIVLAPDMPYDFNGCWSGSSAIVDGKLYLLYTGNMLGSQHQCLAISDDGINFKKVDFNPVIGLDMLPEDSIEHSFRDPYIIKDKDSYYALIANKDVVKDCGRVIVYSTTDWKNWNYLGTLFEDYRMADPGICECPSFTKIDGKDILLTSRNCVPTIGKQFRNFADCIAYIGKLDIENVSYQHDEGHLLDYGFDFYAAQFLNLKDRTVLISWLQMWETTYPTAEYGWVGSLSFPRDVRIVDNKIKQFPVKELDSYCEFVCEGSINNEISIEKRSLRIKIDAYGSRCGFDIIGTNGELKCYYDEENGEIIMNRSGNIPNSVHRLMENTHERIYPCGKLDNIKFDVLIDESTVEVFINDGNAVMTSTFYIEEAFIKLHTDLKLNYQIYEIKK